MDGKRKAQHKIQQKREAHQWWVANKIFRKSDAVAVEDLQIKNMMKRCKPVASETGRFLPNGQAAKPGLNRAIADASWYALPKNLNMWLQSQARNYTELTLGIPVRLAVSVATWIKRVAMVKSLFIPIADISTMLIYNLQAMYGKRQ